MSNVHYKHRLFRSVTMFRGALVTLIFNRTLELQDGLYDESAAVTLMSTDIERISVSMEMIHEVWAQAIEIVIGIWLLARYVLSRTIWILHRTFRSSALKIEYYERTWSDTPQTNWMGLCNATAHRWMYISTYP